MGAQDRPVTLARRIGGADQIEELIQGATTIEIEQRIAAAPATVFSFLTEPEKFVLWMGVGAELDPRPGGQFRIDVDGEHIASGEFKVVDPPRRLVMTWGWEPGSEVPPGSTVVEITLTPEGSGTLMRLRHSGLPTEPQRASHLHGWNLYVERLRLIWG